MLRNNVKHIGLVGVSMFALSLSAHAQVSESPVKDLTPHGARKPPPVPANLPPPNTDPHDLNGAYAFAAPMPAGIGPGGPGPGGPPPTRPRSNDTFVECMPTFTVGAAGSPGLIVQTPQELVFIGEGNNSVRHIYLNGKFPDQLEPRRLGYSIGHWDGDTLVIETRGIKTNAIDMSMSSVTRVTERLHKADGGHTIESVATIEGVGADGQPKTVTTNGSMMWRPDQFPLQVTCEEGQDYTFD